MNKSYIIIVSDTKTLVMKKLSHENVIIFIDTDYRFDARTLKVHFSTLHI